MSETRKSLPDGVVKASVTEAGDGIALRVAFVAVMSCWTLTESLQSVQQGAVENLKALHLEDHSRVEGYWGRRRDTRRRRRRFRSNPEERLQKEENSNREEFSKSFVVEVIAASGVLVVRWGRGHLHRVGQLGGWRVSRDNEAVRSRWFSHGSERPSN